MKSWLQLFCVLSLLCFFPAADTIAASGSPTGPRSTEGTEMAAPLAEMMFYEAAEQAVEDGYAEIIPENPEDKKTHDLADTKNEQSEQKATPSEAVPRIQKE
ncbi:MAG: hypothetical protein U9P36_04440 [Thermodesulfobacteriota bacterium]|nr:hypothetical protein [Thermodesulfobacteriota bacterium]